MSRTEDETEIGRLIADEARRRAAGSDAGRRRKVLLIGGSGYVGTPVAAELLRQGMQVRNVDLFLYKTQSSIGGLMLHPDYEVMVGDLCDPDVLDRALTGVTDVVVLGGLVGDPITKAYPSESHAINEVGIQLCLDAVNGRGLNKVVFVSTCSNYGLMKDGELATEESPLQPLSLYATAKVGAEKKLLAMKSQADFCGVVLRFATAFGAAPRMRFDLTVNEFVRELFAGNELVVYDAQTWRPYCHVSDFARLIARTLLFPAERLSFEVFNAGGDDNNHTKQSIVDLILRVIPAGKVLYKDMGTDPRNYRVDFRKVREVLLFEPTRNVASGIDELVKLLRQGFFSDYAKNRNFYGNYEISYPVTPVAEADRP